jgi:hypothetical protein
LLIFFPCNIAVARENSGLWLLIKALKSFYEQIALLKDGSSQKRLRDIASYKRFPLVQPPTLAHDVAMQWANTPDPSSEPP